MSDVDNHKDAFEEAMQNAFDGFAETADDVVWTDIENQLKGKKRRIAAYWWYSGVAAALALAIGLFSVLYSPSEAGGQAGVETEANSSEGSVLIDEGSESLANDGGEEQVKDLNAAEEGLNDEDEAIAGVEKEVSPGDEEGDALDVDAQRSVSPNNVNAARDEAVSSSGREAFAQNDEQQDVGDPINTLSETGGILAASTAQASSGDGPGGINPPETEAEDPSLDLMPILPAEVRTKLQRSLAMRDLDPISGKVSDGKEKKVDDRWVDWEDDPNQSNFGLLAHFGSSASGTPQGNNSAFLSNEEGFGAQDLNQSVVNRSDRGLEPDRYQAPFSLGVKANISLSRRFSIETGLIYTLLGASQTRVDSGQTLTMILEDEHYLGIPLLLQYRFVDRRRFSIYCVQGVMFDKAIIRNLRRQQNFASGEEVNEQFRGDPSGEQGGLYFGLGYAHRITNTINFYAEPSVTSWIYNREVFENIRNANLLWPSLNLGIRFDL